MAAYDDFAWFYDRYWNEEFHGAAFPILERIWLARVADGARILDVCCGTGRLAALLEARGYLVTGVDASQEMIRHARQNAPNRAQPQRARAVDGDQRRSFRQSVSFVDGQAHGKEELGDVARQWRRPGKDQP